MKSLTIYLIIITITLLSQGCTFHNIENLPLITDLVFPLMEQEYISKNGVLKTIIYYEDSTKQKQEIGYETFDSLGNLKSSIVSYQRAYFEYDTLNLPFRKEFVTDYIARWFIQNHFLPEERKLLQIWHYSHQSLDKIDSTRMPEKDTTIFLFSSDNLVLSESGYQHHDKGLKRISYNKEFFYDSLNRIINIVTSYTSFDKEFLYMVVYHNYWESSSLSLEPLIKEHFKYAQGKLVEKETTYIDKSNMISTFTCKTIYNSKGLKTETLKFYKNTEPIVIKYLHASTDTFKLETAE